MPYLFVTLLVINILYFAYGVMVKNHTIEPIAVITPNTIASKEFPKELEIVEQ